MLLTLVAVAFGLWFNKNRCREEKKVEVVESVNAVNPEDIYQDIKKEVESQYRGSLYQKTFETSDKFTVQVFLETLDEAVAKMAARSKQGPWMPGGTPGYLFVHKLILLAGSEIEFHGDIHGDVRSLIRWIDSLRDLGWFEKENTFKLAKSNQYLAFLGDYTGRGHYGAEVLYIIMQLFLHNPDNILVLRGTHEDLNLAVHYGFLGFDEYGATIDYSKSELAEKFDQNKKDENKLFSNDKSEAANKIARLFNHLPVALFLGCSNAKGDGVDFIQCCHGGLEPLYTFKALLDDPRHNLYEWLDKKSETERDEIPCALHFNVSSMLEECDCSKHTCLENGFQWNDFDFFNENPKGEFYYVASRGKVFHKKLATETLKSLGGKNKVWALLRSHQQNTQTISHMLNYGNGLYRLWSEKTTDPLDWGGKKLGNKQWDGSHGTTLPLEEYSVWSFNVAPRTGFYERGIENEFSYDTVARLILKNGFENWVLQPRKINVG